MSSGVFEDLCESTLINNKGALKKYNARELADLLFLYVITLEIFRNEFKTLPFAKDYLQETFKWNNFDSFKTSATDLYVLIHTLFGKDNQESFDKLADQDASKLLKEKLSFHMAMFRKWSKNIINNTNDETFDKKYLLFLQDLLQITVSDYKSLRRLATTWNDLDSQHRKLAATRLLFALQARAPRSELLPALKQLIKSENLLIKGATNPEAKKPSTMSNVLKGLAIGAAIVGGTTLYKTAQLVKTGTDKKKFGETASSGATGAGSIGVVPTNLFQDPISRNPLKSKNPKKKSKKKTKKTDK